MAKIISSILAVLWLAGSVVAESTNITEDAIWSQHVLNAYKSIQEQHEATMQAVEQVREEAEAAAREQTAALEARLKQLEETVVQSAATQRDHADNNLASSQQFTLKVVGWCAAAGVLCLLVLAVFLARAIQRRQVAPMAVQPLSPLGSGETGLAALDPAQQSSARLRSSLDRLEQRLGELETDAAEPPAQAQIDGGASVAQQMQDLSGRVASLLGKGQALLNLQQIDPALDCFDEIIALDPHNAEAFVKKGAALEKLGRLDEALECYDHAIKLDQSMTMAYLCKGGVFNRLERYTEAAKCYEQALRAQQHLVG